MAATDRLVLASPVPSLPTLRFAVAAIVLLAGVPLLIPDSYYLFLLTFAGIFVLAAMGFNILAGYTGIISLAHGAMFCIGAYTTAILTVKYGWSFWPAAVVAIAVASVVSALISLPALRLSSWYFVLITIAFTTTVTALVSDPRALTGGYGGITGIPAPALLGFRFRSEHMFWLVLALNVGVWWVIANLVNSRVGWSLQAIRDSSICARTIGVSFTRMRLFAFVFAGSIAGLSGALYAVMKVVVTPEDFPFDFSIFFLFILILGGSARLSGPLLGVIAFYIVPELLGSLKEYRMIIYGVGLLAFSVLLPEGIAGGLDNARRRYALRKPSAGRSALVPPASQHAEHMVPPIAGMALQVDKVSKAFGGVRALNDVTLSVPGGSVRAIVGPNGSGKTTLLNLISGLYPATEGSIRLGDNSLTGLAAHQIARLGVRRTFQTPKLLGALSVLENVQFGAYDREQSLGLEVALSLPRARQEREELCAQALALIALVGLADRANDRASELPHGQQRLLEIARALMGRPRLLLLDEPAAGLSMGELERLAELIKEIRRLGVTLIMVEHHVELVMGVAQEVTVLDQGKVLASGAPDEVFRNPLVVSAYTGDTP